MKTNNLKYFNAHAHCFSLENVPEHFFDALTFKKHLISIRRIKSNWLYRNLIRLFCSAPAREFFGLFSKDAKRQLKRLNGLINYGLKDSQREIIDALDKYYPGYRFVLLSMDFDHMISGNDDSNDLIKNFKSQISELRSLKEDKKYFDKIFPFIFADPRREDVTHIVKGYLKDSIAPFQGIKLYPALGYYPFDEKLKEIYEYALENDVPIMTHCIKGDVYCRKNLGLSNDQKFRKHPIAKYDTIPNELYELPSNYQVNFTHPLNYECLLNPIYASIAFGEEVNFRNLKICLAHAGGVEEFGLDGNRRKKMFSRKRYVKNSEFQSDPLNINQNWLGKTSERIDWLTIIKVLMIKYPNVYVDISYILHDKNIYPIILKMMDDSRYCDKVLFGSDYYVVSTVSKESALLDLLRKQLSVEVVQKISYDNTLKYLNNKLNPIIS